MAWLTSARLRALEFGPGVAARVGGGGLQVGVEEVENGDAGQLGGGDGAGQGVTLQLARLSAEEVEGADELAGYDDRHRADAADLVGEQGRAVGRPPRLLGEVDDEHREPVGDRIQAGSLAERELQFVVGAGGGTAGAEGAAAGAVEDERDGGGVDVEKNHAGLAETVGGLYPTPAVDGLEELLVDRHI